MTRPDVRGVLLAGGDSTRFAAGDKALARVDGVPMIRRVADTLREATGVRPAVAAGREPPPAYRDALGAVRFVPDDDAFRGPLAGLVGAARALDDGWLFAAATDMPRLDPATVSWLVDQRTETVDAVVATDADGVPQPLCACYRRQSVLDALSGIHADGGPRSLLDTLDVAQYGPTDTPRGVCLASTLANVNTTDDLDGL